MVTVSPPNPESRQIASVLADLDMRMRRIEAGLRTGQLGNSSLEGSGIAMFDSDGNHRGVIGFQPDGTTTITSRNPLPPPVPSAPQVTPSIATLIVSHTGETQGGSSNPADFSHLNVYTADAANPGLRTFRGTINPVPGEFVVSGLDYISYLVDVTSVNYGGKESTPSPPIAGTPQQVVSADIINGAISDLAIADGAITEAKIAADAVTETKIANDSISTPKVIAGAIGASEIAAGSILAGHIVSRSITADRLVALTLTANEIATNAITAGKIQAGAVTATKLEADLVIANRFIAGSTSGARVEMHPTAGLQAFNTSGTRTFIVEASTGNYFSVGQFATGFSGSRIIMNTGQAEPDTIRLYQTNNTYGIIFADPAGSGAGVFMRGSSTSAGKIGAYQGEGFTSWVDGGLLLSRSAFDCTSGSASMWGGSCVIEAQERWGSGETAFRFRDGSGNSYAGMEVKFLHMASGHPSFYCSSLDLGLSFDSGGLVVQGVAPAVYKPIIASAFTVSGRESKKNEQDVVLHRTSTPRQGISELTPKSWNYKGEWDGTGERPPPPTWNASEVVRDEKGIATIDEDGNTQYEDNWQTGVEVQAVKPHIGLIAEDVVDVFPELVTTSDTIDGGLLLGTNDTLGIMWHALHDEIRLSDSASLKQPRGVTGGSPHGVVVDSMSIPPQPPTTGALLYENSGNLWVVTSIGKRTKLT